MDTTESQKSHSQISEISQRTRSAAEPFGMLLDEVGHVIVGQEKLLHRMLIGLLCRGHLLIEGVPGLAKTLAVSSMAKAIDTGFQRLQFTPDLLPADLIGTLIYRHQEQQFVVQKGPIFSNLILADEINRAPAKVQSALLEAMQERQVTIGSETFPLEDPFLVLATQNPIEQEGTYPLPEAQIDRFMLKVLIDYPTAQQERRILDRMARTQISLPIKAVMGLDEIVRAREIIDEMYLDEKVKDYIVSLVIATRQPSRYGVPVEGLIEYGASPRATIALTLAAKANAFLDGRGYVVPQDVKDLAPDVLRHRLIVSYEAEAEEKNSDDVVKTILEHVPVP
ncbi:MAG: ATPase [Planctomycetota bacterium]|nr:MAG: ATPase [Planctomycetota bacterium]